MTAWLTKLWWVLLISGGVPLAVLIVDITGNHLGSNAAQAVNIRLGDWSLRFLCLTLAVSPVQIVTHWPGMSNFRQLLGLYTWFYATLHVMGYLAADHAWRWNSIGVDIWESQYIWFGILAYLIILLLALTTTRAAKQYLGKNWKKLHRFIYWASVAAMIHYYLQLKGNLADPLFYAVILALLLLFRLAAWYKKRKIASMMIPIGRKPLE